MPARSLTDLCVRAAQKNVSEITDVADISYHILRPILQHITNTAQLAEIEQNSPHIADHDRELWFKFIQRDIPDWKRKMIEPSNPRSWGKVYRKLKRDEDRAKAEVENQLRESMMSLSQAREANSTQIINKVIPQKAKQTRYLDGNLNPHANGSWGGGGEKAAPALRNAKTGKDIIGALRRQTADNLRQTGRAKGPIIKPYLPSVKSQIKEPPRAMARDAQQAPQKPEPVASSAAAPRPWEKNVTQIQFSTPAKVSHVFSHSKKEPSREERALALAIKEQRESKEAAAERSRKSSQARPPAGSAAGSPKRNSAALSSPAKDAAAAAAPSASAAAGTKRAASPPAVPQPVKRRPQASVFMPQKKRKV